MAPAPPARDAHVHEKVSLGVVIEGTRAIRGIACAIGAVATGDFDAVGLVAAPIAER